MVAGLDVIDDWAPGIVCCRSRWPLLEDEGGGGRIGLTVSSSFIFAKESPNGSVSKRSSVEDGGFSGVILSM